MASSSASGSTRPLLIKIKHLSQVRLGRQNYMIWKAHTLAHLCGYELLEFIEGPTTASDPSLVRQDQLLLAWLFSAITPSVLPQIAACLTSYDVWTTLEGIFNSKSKTRLIQLQNQLQLLRKKMMTADEYFAKLTELSEELRQAGVVIDDSELSLIALNGLDETYDSFVTSQTARVDDVSFLPY